MAETQILEPATQSVSAVRRVNVMPARGTSPAIITVYFRDQEAAQSGYAALLEGLVNDPRTCLDLSKPMPTLTYPVI